MRCALALAASHSMPTLRRRVRRVLSFARRAVLLCMTLAVRTTSLFRVRGKETNNFSVVRRAHQSRTCQTDALVLAHICEIRDNSHDR